MKRCYVFLRCYTKEAAATLAVFDWKYVLGNYARSAPTPTAGTKFGEYRYLLGPSDVGLLISASRIPIKEK